ncbi:MAG: MFS transporter [Alphaproteobacteria bacterium]|nr:MFS transporter [Alphaproteobacteria bacterium]
MTATVAFERRDIRVIGLVSGAHFFSHFFFLTLPPLYPILRVEMGVSYTALGATATAFAIASGIGQLPVGFIVDRFGARYVLIGGITLMSLAIGGMGLVPSYFWLPVLALVAGGANSVFHPADYAILSHTVKGTRVGRAYSIHTFSGFLGWAVAPPFMTLIATQWGWRTALFCACTAGLIMAVVLILRRDELIVPTRAAALPGSKKSGGFDVLLHPGILILFCFFIANAMTSVGINTFAVSALHDLHGMEIQLATSALTAYLVAGASGVLLGGYIADRTKRYELVAFIGYVASASAMLAIAWSDLGTIPIITTFALAGIMLGSILPSRDMLVRSMMPPGSAGRIFGFLSAGIEIGATISPLVFGWLIDHGKPSRVFVLCAIFMMGSLTAASLAAVMARRRAI